MKKEIKASFDLYKNADDYQRNLNSLKHKDIKNIETLNNDFITEFADEIQELQLRRDLFLQETNDRKKDLTLKKEKIDLQASQFSNTQNQFKQCQKVVQEKQLALKKLGTSSRNKLNKDKAHLEKQTELLSQLAKKAFKKKGGFSAQINNITIGKYKIFYIT